MHSRQLWQSIRRDLRVALRQARKDRTFTVVALATFALGVGANAAMFSVVRSVLLRPLPYAQPEQLAAIWPKRTISNAELLYMQQHAASFESVAAFSPGWGVAMTGAGEPRQLDAARFSTNFFGVLGVRPMLGRGFLAGESEKGRWNVTVLSHALWLSQFGGDSAAVGRAVDMDGQPCRIVGVMPPSFEVFQANVDAWLPVQIDPASPFHTGATALAFGRLRRGATLAQATRELSALAPQMRAAFDYTDDYARGATVINLHESLVGDARRSILVLYAAVAILGLIAVVNVGNLLLAHAAGRRREMAVRRALGAAKFEIVRQLLVQSLVLAGAGGVIGAAVGIAGTEALRALLAASLPRAAEIHLDVAVIAVTALPTIAAGIAFGIGPALVASSTLGPFLGAVGIYGVVAYGVRRRTREMGIRAALGAVEGRLTAMVLGEGLRMSSLGIGTGVAAAAVATRPMRALLFGVATVDPLVYAAVALTLAGVAIAASLAPARRAARIDPVVALRSD